jgi:hypothetical protein
MSVKERKTHCFAVLFFNNFSSARLIIYLLKNIVYTNE